MASLLRLKPSAAVISFEGDDAGVLGSSLPEPLGNDAGNTEFEVTGAGNLAGR